MFQSNIFLEESLILDVPSSFHLDEVMLAGDKSNQKETELMVREEGRAYLQYEKKM